MKSVTSITLLALIMVTASCYNTWDSWHNVPTAWTAQGSNVVSTLSGWKRNGLDGYHYSGMFNNHSQIFTQYLYWSNSNPDILIMCGPKYYLETESLCKVNPYFKTSAMPEKCIPNYFNHPEYPDLCDSNNLLYGT